MWKSHVLFGLPALPCAEISPKWRDSGHVEVLPGDTLGEGEGGHAGGQGDITCPRHAASQERLCMKASTHILPAPCTPPCRKEGSNSLQPPPLSFMGPGEIPGNCQSPHPLLLLVPLSGLGPMYNLPSAHSLIGLVTSILFIIVCRNSDLIIQWGRDPLKEEGRKEVTQNKLPAL